MDEKGPRIKVLIITQDNEIDISSNLILLLYYLKKVVKTQVDISIMDNHSADRTVRLARKVGVKVYRFRIRKTRKEIVETALEIAKKDRLKTLIILDLGGGNTSEDAISLIARSLDEGERFASAYIQPRDGDGHIGCWALDHGMLGNVGKQYNLDIKEQLLEMASRENLEMLAIDEKFSVQTKRQRKRFMKLLKRSPFELIPFLIKHHPLSFYGAIGLAMLFLALISGIITMKNLHDTNQLNYFPAFTTVALVMIGGFFMVAGLILNAMNVMVEKLEAMKGWLE